MFLRGIRGKIVIVLIGVILITVAVVSGFAVYTSTDLLEKESQKQAKNSLSSLNLLLDVQKDQALAHALSIASNPLIIEGVKKRDFYTLLTVTKKLMENSKLEYMVITDNLGNVIVRTHQPDVIPAPNDNIANQVNIAQALQGRATSGIEEGKTVQLSIRGGAPVYSEDGVLVGVVSTGYIISKSSIVDIAKEQFGTEYTLFLGKERVATTLKNADGKREIGTELANEIIVNTVLKQGQQFFGFNDIFGVKYLTGYAPLIGANGNPVGMIFSGVPLTSIDQLKATVIRQILSAALAVIIAASILAYALAGRITKPLTLMLQGIAKDEQGNISIKQVEISSNDEIGELGGAINALTNQVGQFVSQVRLSVEQIADASKQLTGSAEVSAQSAEQVVNAITQITGNTEGQLSSVEDTAQVVGEISREIHSSVTEAKKATKMSEASAKAAHSGESAITVAINQMQVIEKTVADSAQAVGQLGQQSQEIGQIVETISSIASQTNLLALNAAIEAARAGEYGRGFAVVADEVRKLAEESQQAASQITSLISDIQNLTNDAVKVMETGTHEVKKGTEAVGGAGNAFKEIAILVGQVSKQIGLIANVMEKTADGNEQIVSAVNQIEYISKDIVQQTQMVSSATEEQSASMEEIAVFSESLAQMANALEVAVDKFKL